VLPTVGSADDVKASVLPTALIAATQQPVRALRENAT
jgi:hypothetical protein